MSDGAVSAIGASDRFFDRLPPRIHAGFAAEHEQPRPVARHALGGVTASR